MERIDPTADRPPGDDRGPLDEAIIRARKELLKELAEHENTSEHSGKPCWAERMNIVGYFCHAFGLGRQHLGSMLRDLDAYRNRYGRGRRGGR